MPNKDNAVAFYIMALPFQLLLGAGHIVYILDVQGVRQRVDVAQFLLLHAMVFTRGAVVAIKYAYMSARDLADNYTPAWDGVSESPKEPTRSDHWHGAWACVISHFLAFRARILFWAYFHPFPHFGPGFRSTSYTVPIGPHFPTPRRLCPEIGALAA
jgi:hypothetical protein